jgi:hypothetical protein
MREIGSDERGFLQNKRGLLARLWFLWDKRDLFKVVAIALEALSETKAMPTGLWSIPPASCSRSLGLSLRGFCR